MSLQATGFFKDSLLVGRGHVCAGVPTEHVYTTLRLGNLAALPMTWVLLNRRKRVEAMNVEIFS